MNSSEVAPPTPAIEATRWVAVGTLLALIALGLGWELGVARSLWAVKVLPLCLPLSGLLKMRLYTYRWTSLLVWLYVMEGAVRARDPGWAGPLAIGQAVLAVVLFAACAWHIRLRLARKPEHE
jgi:uncharacterized membrane protein